MLGEKVTDFPSLACVMSANATPKLSALEGIILVGSPWPVKQRIIYLTEMSTGLKVRGPQSFRSIVGSNRRWEGYELHSVGEFGSPNRRPFPEMPHR